MEKTMDGQAFPQVLPTASHLCEESCIVLFLKVREYTFRLFFKDDSFAAPYKIKKITGLISILLTYTDLWSSNIISNDQKAQ